MTYGVLLQFLASDTCNHQTYPKVLPYLKQKATFSFVFDYYKLCKRLNGISK